MQTSKHQGAYVGKKREANSGEGQGVLASRLRELFDGITFVDEHGRRRRFRVPYVAEAINVHRNTIDALRNGRQTNPHHNTVRDLAQFFDEHRDPETWPRPVTVGYLLGEDAEEAAGPDDAQVRSVLADHEVRSVAMRMADADPETRRAVLGVLDVVQSRRAAERGPSD